MQHCNGATGFKQVEN